MSPTADHPLAELRATLEARGYFAAYALLGEGNVRVWDWNKVRDQLSGELRTLWSFLLCGRPVSRDRLRRLVPAAALECLVERGLCARNNGSLSLGDHSLIAHQGEVLFIDRSVLSKALFGEETKALVSLLPAVCPGPVLALFGGCGLELVRAARGQGPLSMASDHTNDGVVRANLELNGLAGGLDRMAETDLPGAGGRTYRTIIANAIGFIEPEGLTMPPVAAGGPDGRRRLALALETAEASLAPGGRLYLVAFFYGRHDGRESVAALERLVAGYGLNYQLMVTSKFRLEPGIPLFGQMVNLAAQGGKQGLAPVADTIMAHLRSTGVDAVYLVKGICTRPAGRRSGRGTVLNFAEDYYGNWTF